MLVAWGNGQQRTKYPELKQPVVKWLLKGKARLCAGSNAVSCLPYTHMRIHIYIYIHTYLRVCVCVRAYVL